jgi:ElaB/YqjD/DUF883 family membrane-anchored ribosome-binding protein
MDACELIHYASLRIEEIVMPNSSHSKNRVHAAAEQESGALVEGFQSATKAVKQLTGDGVDAVRETAQDYMDQGRAKAQELTESMEDRVREQPVKSVLIAAGIGFVLGLFFLRK